MSSMYETIMELPLFKGISNDQVSSLLEKTSIEFLNFQSEDVIIDPLETVRSIDFILSGNVASYYSLPNYDLKVEIIAGKGTLLGATRLFGLHTNYCCKGVALDKVSIMRIDKEQYFALLQTDKIYLLNMLNYLSAAAQKPIDLIIRQEDSSIYTQLLTLVSFFSGSPANSRAIIGADESFALYCKTNVKTFADWKKREQESGRINVVNNKIILIRDDAR